MTVSVGSALTQGGDDGGDGGRPGGAGGGPGDGGGSGAVWGGDGGAGGGGGDDGGGGAGTHAAYGMHELKLLMHDSAPGEAQAASERPSWVVQCKYAPHGSHSGGAFEQSTWRWRRYCGAAGGEPRTSGERRTTAAMALCLDMHPSMYPSR